MKEGDILNQKYSKKICNILKEGERCKKLLGPAPGRRGATGPTGPTGPAGAPTTETMDFGRRYDAAANTITLPDTTMKTIPLGTVSIVSGITATVADTLTIAKTGTYKIDFAFSGSSSASTDVTVEVVRNGVLVNGSAIMRNVTANANTDFIGSIIVALNENDNITLGIDATNATTITPTNGVNAYLSIVQIS